MKALRIIAFLFFLSLSGYSQTLKAWLQAGDKSMEDMRFAEAIEYYNNALDSLDQGSFRFNMINIPLLLNLKLTQKIWIQLGPQFMGSVSMTDKNRVIKSGVDIIKNQNYNFIGGIWLQFGGEAPLIRVNTGIRYIAGLNNMNDLIPNSLWKTQMIQLHIGFSY